jgi:hypothetical protein
MKQEDTGLCVRRSHKAVYSKSNATMLSRGGKAVLTTHKMFQHDLMPVAAMSCNLVINSLTEDR